MKKVKKKTKKKAAKKKATKKPTKPTTRKAAAPRITKKQKDFLDAFEQLGDITAAAKAVGMSRFTHYKPWLKKEAYAQAWAAAEAVHDADMKRRVREAAVSRGLNGWVEEHEEQIIEQREKITMGADGQKIVELVPTLTKVTKRRVKKFSDGLLQRLLNDYWGDVRHIDISAQGGVNGTNGQLQITLEVARQIVTQGEEAKKK